MDRHWTFGQKIIAGFAVVVAFAIAIGAVSTIALRTVVTSKDEVITQDSPRLVLAERMHKLRETQSKINRTYLLSGDAQDLSDLANARKDFDDIVGQIRQNRTTDEGRQAIDAVADSEAEYRQAVEPVLQMRKANSEIGSIVRALNDIEPKRALVEKAIDDFTARETRVVNDAQQAATDTANTAVNLILAISLAAVL